MNCKLIHEDSQMGCLPVILGEMVPERSQYKIIYIEFNMEFSLIWNLIFKTFDILPF